MNYYEARQLKDTGGWHYTCKNDDRVWPVGYCREHEPHATKEEAEDCYRGYLLDNRLRLDGKDANAQHKCRECGEWTSGLAECDLTIVVLCDEHRTREIFEKYFPEVGQIISSW